MKSKIKTKISLAIIALFLLVASPILLAGCAANISIGGGFGVMRKAAHNYFDTRTDYENYADTTISSTLNLKTFDQEKELEYNKNGKTVKEKFKGSMDVKTTRTLYVKNIKDGDNNYVAIVVKADSTTIITDYYVSEQAGATDNEAGEIKRTLATTTDTSTYNATYVLTPIIAETGVSYGLYKTLTETESFTDSSRPASNNNNEVVPVTTKTYKTFAEEDYISEVNGILSQMNDKVIIDCFFSMMNNEEENSNKYASFAQYELDGNNLRIYTDKIEAFKIDEDYYVSDVDASLEIKFKGNKIRRRK